MANIKSAKKRILVNEKKQAQNTSIKTGVKTSMKKVKAAVAKGDKKEAVVLLNDSFSKIDKAADKNIYHKNNAARKKAALANIVNDMNKKK